MDLNHLKTLKVICESSSFSEAATKLNYTRSTITSQVQQMEREFGFTLFEQFGKKMYLTPEGRAILPYIDTILSSYKQILSYGSGETGQLRVAMPESLLMYRVNSVIEEFRKKMPGIDLQIQMKSCYEMIHLLKCDHTEMDSLYHHALDKTLRENNIILQKGMVLSSITAILECVKMGLGISILPDFAVKEQLDLGGIQKLSVALDPANVTVLCSYHKSKHLTPAMRCFLELAAELIG